MKEIKSQHNRALQALDALKKSALESNNLLTVQWACALTIRVSELVRTCLSRTAIPGDEELQTNQ